MFASNYGQDNIENMNWGDGEVLTFQLVGGYY